MYPCTDPSTRLLTYTIKNIVYPTILSNKTTKYQELKLQTRTEY